MRKLITKNKFAQDHAYKIVSKKRLWNALVASESNFITANNQLHAIFDACHDILHAVEENEYKTYTAQGALSAVKKITMAAANAQEPHTS